MTAGFTDHPEYVNSIVNRFPEFVGKQIPFIRTMGTAGVLSSTYWADTVSNMEVIHKLIKELACGKDYEIKLAKDCKFSYHNFVWSAYIIAVNRCCYVRPTNLLLDGHDAGKVRGKRKSVYGRGKGLFLFYFLFISLLYGISKRRSMRS